MSKKKKVLVLCLISFLTICLSCILYFYGDKSVVEVEVAGVPKSVKISIFIYDPHDFIVYSERGSWFASQKKPYAEVFSEYPEVATYFFAAPHIVKQFLPLSNEFKISYDLNIYQFIFSFIMGLLLSLLIIQIYSLKTESKNLAFLLLLPAGIFYMFNRFDVLPAFLSILSVSFLFKGKFKLAFFILAVSIMTKWYTVVMAPVYLSYCWNFNKKDCFRAFIVFVITIAIIAGSTIIWIGIDGFLVPYKFHFYRDVNLEGLLHLFLLVLDSISIDGYLFIALFSFLQFIIIPISLASKINTKEKVLIWSAISILIFMLFNKIYSPQWILWITPFLILLIKTKRDIFFIVLFDLVTYAYCPFALGQRDVFPVLFLFLISLKSLLIVYFIVSLFLRIREDVGIKLKKVFILKAT